MDITHLGSVFTFVDKPGGAIMTYRAHRHDEGDTVSITTEDLTGTLLARTEVGLDELIGWLEKLRHEEGSSR